MRIGTHQMATQRGAGQPFHLCLATGGGEGQGWRRAQNFGIVTIGDDNPAGVRQERFCFQAGTIKVRGKTPIEAVAMVEIIGPFAIAQQIGPADLDLHDHHAAFCIDTHQIRTATVAQRHFRQAPHVITRKKATDATRHGQRLAFLNDGHGNRFDHAAY